MPMESGMGGGQIRSRPAVSVFHMDRIAVIGAGSWGTTVAALAASSVETRLWARRAELADAINTTGINHDYIPDLEIPQRLEATSDLSYAIDGADTVIMAVPSHGFRQVFDEIAPGVGDQLPVISLTKGIEVDSLSRMTQVISDVAPGHDGDVIGVLTGPNLASEIASGQPTASVIGLKDPDVAVNLQQILISPTFRVYTNDDVIGCELGGALKNVMAIASGISDGLGFGDNTRATLLTRALAELTRLGVALGGQPETFAGLAGMGDLIATCSSNKSRNYRVGHGLAQGATLEEIISDMKMVAEGVKTTKSVVALARQSNVEMPIAEHVQLVLDDQMGPREAMLALMTRQAKAE